MKAREREEDAKIAQYIRAKEIREAELLAEKERIAAEKERECAKMRAQQVRVHTFAPIVFFVGGCVCGTRVWARTRGHVHTPAPVCAQNRASCPSQPHPHASHTNTWHMATHLGSARPPHTPTPHTPPTATPPQERAADKQSELDELRARRYQEAKEREWRAKECAALERHASMQKELSEAREAQKNAKLKQQADMAGIEHQDFMRVLAVNRVKEHEEMMVTSKQVRAGHGGGGCLVHG